MTIASIQERVARIESLAQSDAEAAHSERDQLFEDALLYIASGEYYDYLQRPDKPPAHEVAKQVLPALQIKLRFEACA